MAKTVTHYPKLGVPESTEAIKEGREPGKASSKVDETSTDENTEGFDPGEYSIEELEAELDGMSQEELEAALDAERDGKNRVGAVNAIESALDELDEEDED